MPKPDLRQLGQVLGKDIKEFAGKLKKLDAKELIADVSAGPVKLELGEKSKRSEEFLT